MLVFFLFLEKLLHGICFLRNKELLGNNMNHLVPIRMPIVSSKIHLSIIANMLSIKIWRNQFLATVCWIQNCSYLDKNIIAILFSPETHTWNICLKAYSKTCLNRTPLGLNNLFSLNRCLVYTDSNYIYI